MIERDAEIEGDVEQGLLFAVIFVGKLAMLELHRLAFGQEGDLHCVFSGAVYGSGSGALRFFFGHEYSLILAAVFLPAMRGRDAGATRILLLPWDEGRLGLRLRRSHPFSFLSAPRTRPCPSSVRRGAWCLGSGHRWPCGSLHNLLRRLPRLELFPSSRCAFSRRL